MLCNAFLLRFTFCFVFLDSHIALLWYTINRNRLQKEKKTIRLMLSISLRILTTAKREKIFFNKHHGKWESWKFKRVVKIRWEIIFARPQSPREIILLNAYPLINIFPAVSYIILSYLSVTWGWGKYSRKKKAFRWATTQMGNSLKITSSAIILHCVTFKKRKWQLKRRRKCRKKETTLGLLYHWIYVV